MSGDEEQHQQKRGAHQLYHDKHRHNHVQLVQPVAQRDQQRRQLLDGNQLRRVLLVAQATEIICMRDLANSCSKNYVLTIEEIPSSISWNECDVALGFDMMRG